MEAAVRQVAILPLDTSADAVALVLQRPTVAATQHTIRLPLVATAE
jgi:hypothetical protein